MVAFLVKKNKLTKNSFVRQDVLSTTTEMVMRRFFPFELHRDGITCSPGINYSTTFHLPFLLHCLNSDLCKGIHSLAHNLSKAFFVLQLPGKHDLPHTQTHTPPCITVPCTRVSVAPLGPSSLMIYPHFNPFVSPRC